MLPVDAIAPPEAELRLPDLHDRLRSSRQLSLTLAAPLSDEDQTVQPMDDASPTKWHLAHTTWFYESFILRPNLPDYRQFSADFEYCFNSYYESKGERQPRGRRGLLTRPSAGEVREYRAHVDEALARLFSQGFVSEGPDPLAALLELGINHEQQHQELLLTDILSLFAANPLRPAYRQPLPKAEPVAGLAEAQFIAFDGGIRAIGCDGAGFSYDNEGPRHEVLLYPYRLANRCVTNSDWLAFIEAGGYREPLLWLADGWATVQAQGWNAPGYWEERDGAWQQMTLEGLLPVDPRAPVTHISYYEANAYAHWAGKRLPTEFEWEAASAGYPLAGNDLTTNALRQRPAPLTGNGRLAQMFGDVWEWTSSAYLPYPGYRPAPGAVGEYNGKFMVSQNVLRGGSCATPPGHIRATYRNFFFPHQRWQFTGLRLAEDAA
ncbi:MAG TPA: ergothioneine biosynthesis protein EgtB [Hyphomicrobium sp.]|jgi:ergothioneine biosynthesis protein EgtB